MGHHVGKLGRQSDSVQLGCLFQRLHEPIQRSSDRIPMDVDRPVLSVQDRPDGCQRFIAVDGASVAVRPNRPRG